MITDPLQLRNAATAKGPENFRVRDFLKHRSRLSSGEIDALVSEISARVWKSIDCTQCGILTRLEIKTEEDYAGVGQG